MVLFLLIGVNVFAFDVTIDQDGNVTAGASGASGTLEVTGRSAGKAIIGIGNDTGGVGVYGIHQTNGDFGLLGGYNSLMQPVGVYGYSLFNWAGYFEGDVNVAGNLSVDGGINFTPPLALSMDAGGYTIHGINNYAQGIGVRGDGGYMGVWGHSTTGIGIYGEATSTSGLNYGVFGYSQSSSGRAVYGKGDNGAYAGYFDGNVEINGNLTVINGSLTAAGIDADTVDNMHAVDLLDKATYDSGDDGTVDNADMVDGKHASDFAPLVHGHSSLYGKVTIVAQSGGQYTNPRDALLNIADWCGTPSSANLCLLKILPGIYDLGNNGLAMRSYVDIEGSGENVTIITSTHSSGTSDESSATVVGKNNAEIRFLTVENHGGSTNSIALYNYSASPKITNVTANATGGSNNYGILNSFYSSPVITNVVSTASGGTSNMGIFNLTSSSPTMNNVTADASGGSATNVGVSNWQSSPVMTNITAAGSGGTDSYGVSNSNYSLPVMTAVIAEAAGASSNNYGVSNSTNSFPVMKDVSSNGIVINGNHLFVPGTDTPYANGLLLMAVFNEITGLGTPTSTNPYVIKLDAGVYDIGNNGITMQSYADIEGSGENATTITSTHSSAPGLIDENAATVVGADNAEIRFLTVENKGGYGNAVAIYSDSTSPMITKVTATVSGASRIDGVYSTNASPILRDVTARASGESSCHGISNISSSQTKMTNVTVELSCDGNNHGISNFSSTPIMTDVSITVTGNGVTFDNYGIYNNVTSLIIRNVTITVSGGGYRNYGVRNVNASPTLINAVINALGGSYSYGVYNYNGSSSTIEGSSISATTYSIVNENSIFANVGATMLGGTVFGGGFTCVGAYGSNFVALNPSCQ